MKNLKSLLTENIGEVLTGAIINEIIILYQNDMDDKDDIIDQYKEANADLEDTISDLNYEIEELRNLVDELENEM